MQPPADLAKVVLIRDIPKQLPLFPFYYISAPNNIQESFFSLQVFSDSLCTEDAQSMSSDFCDGPQQWGTM